MNLPLISSFQNNEFKIMSYLHSLKVTKIYLLVSVCLFSIIIDHTYIWYVLTRCSYILGVLIAHIWLEGAYWSWWCTFLEEIVQAKLIKLCPQPKNFFLFWQMRTYHLAVEASPFLVIIVVTACCWIGSDSWRPCEWVMPMMSCPHHRSYQTLL